ncbi:RIB43A-domain-containing protein [Gorgonomyces haynaldii]|nr:RIB43A-domain-containing protein [Gorgonomyces haynaldii]
MYKVEILQDDIQKAAIARRQKLDEERKQRIFNPKVRCLGIDLEALSEQIDIKTELKAIEQQRNDAMDRQAVLNADILTLMDQQVLQERRDVLKQTNDFRKQHQQAHQRRDFDLYDPLALKKDLPARIGDNDPRTGPSSLQKFNGEDLGEKQRLENQKEQRRVWTDLQMYEKEAQRQRELNEKKEYEHLQKNILDKMNALHDAVVYAKREQAKLDNDYNLQLAAEKKRREQSQKQHEEELNTREILNHVNGIFLTETPDVFNIGGGHKVRVDLFKGMTPQQKQEILRVQEQQRLYNQEKKTQKDQEENLWAIHDISNRRAIALLDRATQRAQKEKAIQLRKENELKALQDKQRKEYIDKVLYTNPPKEEYFEQFNTTSR